jgi:hypothetical protein
LIDTLQEEYFAGREVGADMPHIDERFAAIIVTDSLEADTIVQSLPYIDPDDFDVADLVSFSDWTRAVASDLFTDLAQQARDEGEKTQARGYWRASWATLQTVCTSPTASPMLDYPQMFLDVGQHMLRQNDPGAIDILRRALVHDLEYGDGDYASDTLIELAEAHLLLGNMDDGIYILTTLLCNDPGDFWVYSAMAHTLPEAGMPRLGVQAATQGLKLLETVDAPEDLRRDLQIAMAEAQTGDTRRRRRGRQVSSDMVAAFNAALGLSFGAAENRPIRQVAREVVPHLSQVPVKKPEPTPELAPPPKKR